MFKRIRTWLKKNWKQATAFTVVIYTAHIIIEAVIINTLASIIGVPIPVLKFT